MMYTYLENIDEVKTRYNFPHNLIGKIRDVVHCTGATPYYRFILFNDNCECEFTCVVKESLFEQLSLTDGDSVVVEYAPLNNFMGIGECLLIRKISRPVMGLTGNKNEDILILLASAKKLIESEYQDGNLIQSYHSHVNNAYLKLRTSYLNSRKRKNGGIL